MPEVQITNPSGGILGDDRLEMEVVLASGASATVITQAANKAYRGAGASQRTVLRVESGAFLEYLPHHLIPYSDSAYHQETTFNLAPGATLISWDAYSAGRVARGERFAFERLSGRLQVRCDSIPEVIDGFDLPGGAEHFGGYSYTASVYVLSPHELGPLAEGLHESFAFTLGVLASASAPSPHLCAVRLLTHDASTLYRLLNNTRDIARQHLGLLAAARAVL